MILLQRIILQINKDEEKTLGNIRQRAVLINGYNCADRCDVYHSVHKSTDNHYELLKIRKQMRKLKVGQARQGTETLGIVFMRFIIHYAKICAYAIYNK